MANAILRSKAREFAPLVNVSLEDLVPRDHCYRQLERTLECTFVHEVLSS
jgi:hypothetical protein